MEYETGEGICLTLREFFTLLAAVGRRDWLGLVQKEDTEGLADEKALHVTLVSLFQKDVIVWEGIGLRLLPPYDQMFRILGRAESVWYIWGRNDAVRTAYIYENQAVLIEWSRTQEHVLCLESSDTRHLCRSLFDSGILAENIEKEDIRPETALETFLPKKSAMEYLETETVIAVLEQREIKTAKMKKRCIVQEQELHCLLYVQTAKDARCLPCTCENVKEAIFGRETDDLSRCIRTGGIAEL